MAWIKLHYDTPNSKNITGYFNTDQIFMVHQHGDGTRLHFNVPAGDGHKTRDVLESVEVVSVFLDVENLDD